MPLAPYDQSSAVAIDQCCLPTLRAARDLLKGNELNGSLGVLHADEIIKGEKPAAICYSIA